MVESNIQLPASLIVLARDCLINGGKSVRFNMEQERMCIRVEPFDQGKDYARCY